MPLTINCWPSSSGAESYVNIEYESTVDFDLQNVAISIPVPSASSAPRINQVRGESVPPRGWADTWPATSRACVCTSCSGAEPGPCAYEAMEHASSLHGADVRLARCSRKVVRLHAGLSRQRKALQHPLWRLQELLDERLFV